MKPSTFSVPAPNAHQKMEPTVKFQYVAKLKNAPRVAFGPPPTKRELSSEATAVFATPGPSEYGVDAGYKHVSTLPRPPAFTMVRTGRVRRVRRWLQWSTKTRET